MSRPDVSIVVPLYNEEDNVDLVHAAVRDALAGERFTYELVFVDDGSKDATRAHAVAVVERDPGVRLVVFRRNYGQTAAMCAGIREARGRVIVTMDGDLQNDPTDIPRLLAMMDQGFDIVVGWRKKRQDEGGRVFVSKIANRIIAGLMGVAVRDSGCSLKAYRAELIQRLPMYGEMHRFIPALSQLGGARLAQIEVKHHPRQFGVSKYGYSRIFKVMLDIFSIRMLLSYARRPLLWHSAVTTLLLTMAAVALLAPSLLLEASSADLIIWMLIMSLVVFIMAWGTIGQIFAYTSRTTQKFSSLAATLSSRLHPDLSRATS